MSDENRTAYTAALQMANYEGALIWTTFQALLAANSLLLALAGAILKLFPELPLSPRVVGVAGVVLCVAWVLVMMRQFDYYKYWFSWARDRERTLGEDNSMIRSGKLFADGNSGQLHRMRWGSRLFRVEWLVYLVISIFVYFYVVIFRYHAA